MRFGFYSCCCIALLLGARDARADAWGWIPEIRALEAERAALRMKLGGLPAAPPVQLTQRLGWHSEYGTSETKTEWVELNLGQAQALDAVVLIAPPPNGAAVGAGYGFPRRFYVELLGEDPTRTIIADHMREDFPNPGTLPVVIPAQGKAVQKVRITATRLFGAGDRFFFALGEVMLLQGKANLGPRIELIGPLALSKSSSEGTRPDWGLINLVDGHSVLGPPLGTRRSPTLGFRSEPMSEGKFRESQMTRRLWVELDLGAAMPIDEVRLFPANPPRFAHTQGYGFPVRYEMELRDEANDIPRVLLAPQSGSYNAPPGGNVVTLPGGGHRARRVRLNVLEPHVSNGSGLLALAEMQVWSGGKNIAPGSAVKASDATEAEGWSKAALVDGFASSADILDWPEWLAGLSQRREILHQLDGIAAQREAVAQRWQRGGTGLILLLGLATVAAVFVWLHRQRKARQAELERLRQRIAQDLHDEIGSSLGSIALIAQDILADDQHARADLTEIKTIADETVGAMRDITRLIQSERYGTDDLPTLLRETAQRMLRGIQHDVRIDEQAQTRLLAVDRQRDLMLIFKEALHNITRHAGATEVGIQITQSGSTLLLTVQDNGHGFDPAAPTTGMGLTNLRRRAGKHQGRADLVSTPQGTTFTLTLPLHA